MELFNSSFSPASLARLIAEIADVITAEKRSMIQGADMSTSQLTSQFVKRDPSNRGQFASTFICPSLLVVFTMTRLWEFIQYSH